jgi:photosynthetic reaction center cytochrome c subunit
MHRARAACLAVMVLLLGVLAACERTPTEQRGYRGLAMQQVGNAQSVALASELNALPTTLPRPRSAGPSAGPSAGDEYTNVQELGDLTKAEFARLMLSFKTWIAPEEGCGYCHDVPDYASDAKPTKRAARAMIRITREINTRWAPHVKATGVTCYTCHRGQTIPPKVWFSSTKAETGVLASRRSEVNMPTPTASHSLILADPLSQFLLEDNPIRVVSTAPLKAGNNSHIRDARSTYALMTVISDSLGVNCTYCHNSRAFFSWDESTPQRVTAWHGLRMVGELNRTHIAPLAGLLEPAQLGPAGDGPKVYCATCHLGVRRPLNGVNMVKDFPELIGTKAQLAAAPPPAAAQGLATAVAAQGR